MSPRVLRVGLIGAAGAFGRRLAEQLAAEPGIDLVLAGRGLARAEALRDELLRRQQGSAITAASLDRERVTPDDLRKLALDVVIDAAGPFQDSTYRLVEAAIAARCHYVDLADARDFVAGIVVCDAAARDAGVAVITGASSTPALSHAVLDRLTRGWQRIDSIRVAILPGRDAPRGRSVVAAILSWVGRPVRVFRLGDWREYAGWSGTRRFDVPGLGPRHAALAETADLDLLVSRFRPRVTAEFLAGLEPPLLHHGLAALGAASRWIGLPLSPLAGVLPWLARPFARAGRGPGGMWVEAKGQDPSGRPAHAVWALSAPAGRGPTVPGLPAVAIVRKIAAGTLTFRGASACVGFLNLTDFTADFARLAMTTVALDAPLAVPLFERALGDSFGRLPPVTQALHTPAPVLAWDGRVEVTGAASGMARMVAVAFGLPTLSTNAPIRVVIEADGEGERWSRIFPDRVMTSVMHGADPASRTVRERFGWLDVRLRIDADGRGVDLVPVGVRFAGLPLPLALLPGGTARETADEAGRHHFDVDIRAPLVGRLVHYRGWLAPASEAAGLVRAAGAT